MAQSETNKTFIEGSKYPVEIQSRTSIHLIVIFMFLFVYFDDLEEAWSRLDRCSGGWKKTCKN